jgi:ABC-type polysaccharide/polyol phosphate transport system ATPase subunit
MGKYINIGNAEFESVRKDEYVDKSMLIAYVNSVLGSQRKFLFVSHNMASKIQPLCKKRVFLENGMKESYRKAA